MNHYVTMSCSCHVQIYCLHMSKSEVPTGIPPAPRKQAQPKQKQYQLSSRHDKPGNLAPCELKNTMMQSSLRPALPLTSSPQTNCIKLRKQKKSNKCSEHASKCVIWLQLSTPFCAMRNSFFPSLCVECLQSAILYILTDRHGPPALPWSTQ